MTVEEKVLKNSRSRGDSNDPRGSYDHAEREGLQPTYAKDIVAPEEMREKARDAAITLIAKAKAADEGMDAEKFAKAAQIMSNMSGGIPPSSAGPSRPTNAIQINVGGSSGPVEFSDDCIV